MRILLINYEYPPVGGGAANATREIGRALAKLGHEPLVLTARYRFRQSDTANTGIKVIEVPAVRRRKDRSNIFEMTAFAISATLRIRSILRSENIDGMIAFFSIPCGPVAWWGWRKTKIPYIISLRGGDVPGAERSLNKIHNFLRPLRRELFRRGTATVANSHGLSEMARRADRQPVTTIPNGVDIEFWRPPAASSAATPCRLLFVGRFHPQKNLPWLFENLVALTRAPMCDDWELHLVGDGPQRGELERCAAETGLSLHLRWHGWVTRETLRDLYQRSHVLINPSAYEGMPNVVLEAMACGLPAALSGHEMHREIIRQSGAGIIFSLDESIPWDAILTLASKSRQRYSSAARSYAVQRLSWEFSALRYLQLFENSESMGEPA